MVKEGNLKPFGCESNALNCFVCRVKTKEPHFANFSPQFVNLMNLTLCVEITRVQQQKLGGSPGMGLEVLKDLQDIQDMNSRIYADDSSQGRRKCNFERSEWFAKNRSKVILTGKDYNPFRDRNPPP